MSFLSNMRDIFLQNYPAFLKGTISTVFISLVGTAIGFLIGLLIGIMKTWPEGNRKITNVLLRFVKGILTVYVQILRGTPMIVQAMLIYYGLLLFAGIDLAPLNAAFIIVSLNTGAYMAEVVRGGIASIPRGQWEAANALGMTHLQSMVHVILPQAIRNIIPSVGNEFIINIKDTSVLNVITVNELFFVTRSIAGGNFMYFETYLIASLIYLILTLSIAFLLGQWERKLSGPANYKKSTVFATDVLKSSN